MTGFTEMNTKELQNINGGGVGVLILAGVGITVLGFTVGYGLARVFG